MNESDNNKWKWVIASQLGFVVLLLSISPLLKSTMTIKPHEASDQQAAVKNRLHNRQAAEKAKRKKMMLSKNDVEKLKKAKERQAHKQMKSKLVKMLELQKRVKAERDKKELLLSERKLDNLREPQHKYLARQMKQMKRQSKVLKNDADGEEQKRIEKHINDLEEMSEDFKQGDEHALAKLKRSVEKLSETLKDLRVRQEQAISKTESNEMGLPEHTVWMEGLTNSFMDTLKQAQQTSLEDYNDTSFMQTSADLSKTVFEEASLQQLYDEAKVIEEAIANDFQAARRMDMAMREGMSVQEVAKSFSATTPQRSDKNFNQMASALQTVDDMSQYGRQLKSAFKEVDTMMKSAATMAEQITGQGPVTSLQQAIAKARQQQKIQSSVRSGQADGANAMNLAALMRAVDTSSNSSKSSSPSGASSSALAMGISSAEGQSNSSSSRGKGSGGGQPWGEGSGDRSRSQMQGGKYMESTPNVQQKLIHLNTKKIQAEAMAGRRFTSNSGRSGWLYVDTWYVIGPWENYGKIDYNVAHAPEFEFDLGKIYSDGKKDKHGQNREVKWEFTQSSDLKVIPPQECGNSTYYAWSEVYFEEGQDMLIAIASDDASKVWINDMLIWEDHGQSAWSLDEGYRVVYFKSGFNKILVRIENGPTLCSFSVLMCPPSGT